MADAVFYFSLAAIFLLLAFKYYQTKTSQRNLPPSPPGRRPITGHLHLQKHPMHRTFQKLAQKHGPVFSLRFGSRLVVIVSSPSAVEECFTKNDLILANRPKTLMGACVSYNRSTLTQSSFSDHWRNLRRIATSEILSNNRMNMHTSVRKDEVMRLITKLSRESLAHFANVELKSMLMELIFNVMIRMIAGKRYYAEDVANEAEASRFRKLIKELVSYYGVSNPADFLPFWRVIDGGVYKRKVLDLAKRTHAFLQWFVDNQRSRMDSESLETVVYNLLSMQKLQPEFYTDEVIKGFVLVPLLTGSDAPSVTLEWTMASLLNNPHILKKARDELDREIGQDVLLEESDLAKLPYLQNIITESLRLYPPAPLLDPHRASEDCAIAGYHIPRNAIVLINAWALQRDPTIWDDPDTFKPERYEKEERSSLAHKLVPFGLGRRFCPGISLANRIIGLALGSMIQRYDWKRVNDQEEIDMTEGEGITVPMAVPLEAMCRARPLVSQILS